VDFELIIVDDGSRDGTPVVLAALESDRCRTFRNPVAGGVSAARNRGAREARREFLLFLDDDDQLRPGALELFRGRLQANPAADFAWGGRRISEKDAGDRLVRVRRDVWSTGGGLVGGTAFLPFVLEIAASCAFTLRRRVFADLGGFDEQLRVGEDRDLFLRLAAGGYQGCCVADLVVDIDEHLRDSLSRTGDRTVGPASDLRIMDKHRAYLSRPENALFLDRYLLQVYAGFLLAGNQGAARDIATELRRRNAYDTRLLRMYLRHSTVFRTLKSALHYDAVRRVTGRARVAR
jgi:glycosyltransferase involved in cell wall biosynthesis